MNFKEIDEKISQDPAIRIKGLYKNAIPKDLETFIYNLLKDYVKIGNTIDINSKQIITSSKLTRRSLGEITKLCEYYLKNVTSKDVFNCLHTYATNPHTNIISSYCYRNDKRMYYFANNRNSYIYDTNQRDEYENTIKHYLAALNSDV